MTTTKSRVRRSKDESRQLILDAAEALLRQSGSDAVNVRAVAAKVGLTDAAVNHHFGTRQKLLEALLRHGGRRLKDELNAGLVRWQKTDHSVERLVDIIADLYADGDYAALALRLHLSGWRDRGVGLLSPVVEALHDMRLKAFAAAGKSGPPISETRFIVGLMHQAIALDPLFGSEFRRSAGMARSEEPFRDQKKKLWGSILRVLLSVESRDHRGLLVRS
ncbi:MULTISPECIES: TetR/AcrR family transcriptional regulator [unclassified Afipia]|uniref:TetR/AcrR family transcriptional regulator n=1 Tax=unclassified Afipia TaxID=2642050 RepID=UPI000467B15F|nr:MULTISPECIES: TetR/AcrR family transcriptional regulator [unclassified Afipia]